MNNSNTTVISEITGGNREDCGCGARFLEQPFLSASLFEDYDILGAESKQHSVS